MAKQAGSQTTYAMGQTKEIQGVLGLRTAQTHAAYLLPHLQPTDKFLDVGCGPGGMTCSFAALLHAGSVIGIDQSPEAIQTAEKTASTLSISNISFQLADATKLPFADDTFDVVHAHAVVMHLQPTTRVAAFKEMKRVVKPGGLIAMRDFIAKTWVVYPEELQPSLSVVGDLIDKGGADANAGLKTHVWAREIGLEIVMHGASPDVLVGEYGRATVRGIITGIAPKAIAAGLMSEAEWENHKKLLEGMMTNEDCWAVVTVGETIARKPSV